MKYLIVFLLLFCSCSSITKKPLLQEGSCYSVDIYGTGNVGSMHELSSFKIIKIFDWEGRKHYAIQVLTTEFKNGTSDLVPLYPKTKSLGYTSVDEFDKYISPNVGKFYPITPQTIKCNPISEDEWNDKAPRLPLMRVGSDIAGTAK